MATFDQVTVETSQHTDVAFQTDPSAPTAGDVDVGVGVYGNVMGVFGWGGTGVVGTSVAGGDGLAIPGAGVVGGGSPVGVVGQGLGQDTPGDPNADGVRGYGSGTFSGVAGWGDPSSAGVSGPASIGGIGVYAEGPNGVVSVATDPVEGFALSAQNPGGNAAFFEGQIYVNGGLDVFGGKSAVVPLGDGTHARLYSVESPESWFEEVGFGTLVNGRAKVALDPDFAFTVEMDQYHVFVTEYDANNFQFGVRWCSRARESSRCGPRSSSSSI